MIGIVGQLALMTAFVAGLFSLWAFYRATVETDAPGWMRAARWSWGVLSLGVGVAAALLMMLLLRHDFSYAYVYQYSSKSLPIGYLVSTFWAGQEGSFLLWIVYTAVLGWALLKWSPKSWRAPVMVSRRALRGVSALDDRRHQARALPHRLAGRSPRSPSASRTRRCCR